VKHESIEEVFAMKTIHRSHWIPTAYSRRDFLWLSAGAAFGILSGCATNPVTGNSQLMLMSENDEIRADRQSSPHQFSTDYGKSQDTRLNRYIDATGQSIAALTHRAEMPYSFQCVNATYVNAYAFPGGSIAMTRGILLELENEAELAALIGHELGHVNARHTAEQMSKSVLIQGVVGGIAAYAGSVSSVYGQLAQTLGMVGSGALLASYSRDNEREADALGLRYMVQAGYGANGFIGLMDMLRGMSRHKSNAFELMFATHPMSDERYETAEQMVNENYRNAKTGPLYRERYMDNTSGLRSIRPAIKEMQKGEELMGKQKYPEAETHFRKALKTAPDDYAGLAMLSKCLLAQNQYQAAEKTAERAKAVYPQEAQAVHLSGFSKIRLKQFGRAYQDFSRYDKLLPGNPNTAFFKGFSLEGMQRYPAAATEYQRYLQSVRQGNMAEHAYSRLVEWGYVRQ
jgi:beta-barrel assembly-enhancing protease